MSAAENVRAIAYGGFILFVALPLMFKAANLAGTSEATTLIESAATPWWIGIAKATPFLLVILIGVLVWAGAEDIL